MNIEDIKRVVNSVKEANEFGLLNENDVLTGYSGKKVIGLLQRLAKSFVKDDTCYLEVGVFQGLTLLSVANSVESKNVFGIDNFAFFDKDKKNLSLINERKKRLGIDNGSLINEDYEDALENLKDHIGNKKVSVYFIDGPHDYRSQFMCLSLILPYLADNAVIIIDDCNYRHVRQANRDFLKVNPGFKLLFEAYTKVHPLNLSEEDRKDSQNGWWDGINVIVKDDSNILTSAYPETIRERTLYENDHAVHSFKYAELVPKFLIFTKFLFPFLQLVVSHKKKFIGKFSSMNTFSDELTAFHLNDGVLKN